MNAQVHSSSELPLEYNQNHVFHRSRLFMTLLANLRNIM